MSALHLFFLYAMALVYVLGGFFHFRAPDFYRPMMPPYLPAHDFLINLSGVIEIMLGVLLLWPTARPWAAWGIILLLVAVFPVHLYMFQARHTQFSAYPLWLIVARMPMQLVLIAWAYLYTR